MPKFELMDYRVFVPDMKPADFVKSLVAWAYPHEDLASVDRSDWLDDLRHAKGVPWSVKRVDHQMVGRSRWAVGRTTYMVTGYPGYSEDSVVFISAIEDDGATEAQESDFLGYAYVTPKLRVVFE